MSRRGSTALIAKRSTDRPITTTELEALADSAGYEVVDTITQAREPHARLEFGPGKVETIADRVESTGADVVICDNDLGPVQAYALADEMGVEVLDRKRLVLDIFAARAETRRARLEVELAERRYDLPRAEVAAKRGETSGRQGFKSAGESEASQVRAAYKREIKQLEQQLAQAGDESADRREARRNVGFDLVALAGYTNAGKSTLLRRLADDLTVDESRHEDLTEEASVEDRLFETLGTTTRRASLGDRRVLLTDTVGFVSDLPHWLVSSFETTLAESYQADVVCLVIDASDDPDVIERKVETSLDVIGEFRDGPILPVLNKADVASGIDDTQSLVAELLAEHDRFGQHDPVVVSALEPTGLGDLATALDDALPDREHVTLALPNSGDAQSLVSWCYDHGTVHDVTYGDEVTLEFEARPEVVAQAEGRAAQLDE